MTAFRTEVIMSFEGIKRSFESMDYAQWASPATLIVFVPGLSSVAQKIQMAHLLPLPPVTLENRQQVFDQALKVPRIIMWHLFGSVVQGIAWTIAMKITALPLFSIMSVLAVCELGYTVYNLLKYPGVVATDTEIKHVSIWDTCIVEHAD